MFLYLTRSTFALEHFTLFSSKLRATHSVTMTEQLPMILILGVYILLRVSDPGDGGGILFRLRNFTIVGYFLLLTSNTT
jgi:hypothetical protein